MHIRTALWFVAVPLISLITSACGSTDNGGGEAIGAAQGALSSGHVARSPDRNTESPIKHVIVIVGENRTFDHVYATYKPKHNQKVWNLRSRKIINADGTPGPNYREGVQHSAVDSAPDGYRMSPGSQAPYSVLPTPLSGGPTTPYVATVDLAKQVVYSLPEDYYQFLTTGGTGLANRVPDTRIPNVTALPPGPFQLTPGIGYDDYSGDPVHRFYQMWQQLDCSVEHATQENPAGCRNDLFPWVESTISTGSNGNAPRTTDIEGARSMGFYNVEQGDAPYFKYLADTYAMSDNFHQAIEGGTGANHVALGSGDAIWFSDGQGNAATPPTLNTENPDPLAGTNNWYTQDGYSGGTYSECFDATHPGVSSVVSYLDALHVKPNCEAGHYYLLNNYAPGYFGDGTVNNGQFAIPPSTLRTIGDELLEHRISWRYYGDHWNRYVADTTGTDPADIYCDICNPFQYSTSIMTNPAVRTEHIKDTLDLYADIENGWLPAVSIVKPNGLVDGHPASSKLGLYEGFSKKIIDGVKAHPELWKETAILVTFDEGGGYYDSGYVAPIDFFGDGTRVPLVAVSPLATGGHISHHYSDHASILKFIERNWDLKPVTRRSRDNLPNPKARQGNPWVPVNGPALDDLFDLFDFGHRDCDQDPRDGH